MNPNIPKTPFSLTFRPRKGLLSARIRAVTEAGRRRRSSLPAVGLLLLILLLGVNLVSCATPKTEPSADPVEPSSDLVEPSSDPVEPSADPVVPSADPVVPSAIAAVLAGEKEFYSGVYGGFLDLAHLSRAEIPDYPEIETDFPCYISQFAVADLDGDGTPEALLTLAFDTYDASRTAVFHERDGVVYVYVTNFRSLHPDSIYTDGTVIGSGASYLHYICKITSFTDDGEPVFEEIATLDGSDWSINGKVYASESKFLTAESEFLEGKTLVKWYPYAGADFSQYFG